jgi:hypothetical protein
MKRNPLKVAKLSKSPLQVGDLQKKADIYGCDFVEIPFSELLRFYHVLASKEGVNAEFKAMGLTATSRSRKRASDYADKWNDVSRQGFYGGTFDTMQTYIKQGFQSNQYLGTFLPGVLRTKDGTSSKGRWIWDESGDEIDVGLALSGDPNCFRSFQDMSTRGGLNVRALYSFCSGTDFDVIAEYGAWLARLLGTANAAGISPALSIDQYSYSLADDSRFSCVRTLVKRENDALDWNRYSCLFSPCGYRHLGFAAMIRAGADKHLLQGSLSGGLGGVVTPTDDWDLSWDQTTRTLTVWGPASPESFDEDGLTSKLIEAGVFASTEERLYS